MNNKLNKDGSMTVDAMTRGRFHRFRRDNITIEFFKDDDSYHVVIHRGKHKTGWFSSGSITTARAHYMGWCKDYFNATRAQALQGFY